MGRKEEGFQAFLTQPPVVLFAMRSVTVINLRLCDRKKSLGARRFGLMWIRFTFAVNSRSGSGSAVVVSNCYQLAWILAVSRVASEVYDSRRWLKFKRDHSPLFSSAKLKMAIAAVKVIWVSSDDKTDESEVGAYMANN